MAKLTLDRIQHLSTTHEPALRRAFINDIRELRRSGVPSIGMDSFPSMRKGLRDTFRAGAGVRGGKTCHLDVDDRVVQGVVGSLLAGANAIADGLVGLTEADVVVVRDTKTAILGADTDGLDAYLSLENRNTRYDGVVKRIIAGTEAPTADLAQEITDDLADKLLRIRGQAVGRDAASVAFNAGMAKCDIQNVAFGDVQDTRAQFFRKVAELEPATRRGFIEAMQGFTDTILIADLEAAIRADDIGRTLDILQIDADTLDPLRVELETAYVAGGQVAIATIPKDQNLPNGTKANIRFTGQREREAAQVRVRIDLLVGDINTDNENKLRVIIADAKERGINPRQSALDIVGRVNRDTGQREGGVLNLTSKDDATVRDVQRGLAGGDRDRFNSYFNLKSRNKSLDGLVRREFNAGKVSADTLRKVRNGMTNGLLFERGRRFARTETLGAFGDGRDMAYQRIIESGISDGGVHIWDTTGDGVVRGSHTNADRQERPFGVPFDVNGQRLLRPRDRSLGANAAETVNCRCFEIVRLNYINHPRAE